MRRLVYLHFPLGLVGLLCCAWAAAVWAMPGSQGTPLQKGPHPGHLAKVVVSPTTPGKSDGLRSPADAPTGYRSGADGQPLPAEGKLGGNRLMGKTYGGTCTPQSADLKTVAIMAIGFAGLVGAGRRWGPPSP